ncbi:MAG TPA: hypothetical protein VEV84_02900 [Pyrinomonadaceae bacterium]|nr:hypothetical protein [Pyrinomonadaceae bacterium]
MQDLRLTYNDLFIYLGIANTVLGFLFGLFPLIVGLKTGNRKFGVIGLIASLIGGFLLSIVLAVPVAIVFTLLALRPASSAVTPSTRTT